jgi:hypothetical protein
MKGRANAARWAIAAILAVFGMYLALSARADRTLDRGFRAVAEGASRAEVVALLGPPDATRSGCRDLPTWMNRPILDAACAEELEYRARLTAVYWTIGFDAQGRAIAKYRYVSR